MILSHLTDSMEINKWKEWTTKYSTNSGNNSKYTTIFETNRIRSNSVL